MINLLNDIVCKNTTKAEKPNIEQLIPLLSNLAVPAYQTHLEEKQIASDILANGWKFSNFPPLRIDTSLSWPSGIAQADRSRSLQIHEWLFLDPLLAEESRSGDDVIFFTILNVVIDWIDKYPDPAHEIDDSFAWYNVAVGVRASRLAYILHRSIKRLPQIDMTKIEKIWDSLWIHHILLEDDRFIHWGTNYGIFQILNHLMMAWRLRVCPVFEQVYTVNMSRLIKIIDLHFHPNGFHKEHSPYYHWLLLKNFKVFSDSAKVINPVFSKRIHDIEVALIYFVTPKGVLVQFGDTDVTVFKNEALLGKPYVNCTSDLNIVSGSSTEAGYFFVRSKDGQTYIAQICCFNSRVHKHADDLSFIWFDRGQEILVDAGRFGYRGRTNIGTDEFNAGFWYSDPDRIYVESTPAHNCVTIDGISYPRRTRKAYGSALKWFGETDAGIAWSESTISLPKAIVLTRLLLHKPKSWLIIVDLCRDRSRKHHHYQQWFHLAPHWHVEPCGTGWSAWATADRENECRLFISSLITGPVLGNIYIGAREPQQQGWYSPREGEIIPNPAFSMNIVDQPSAIFATIFTFSKALIVPGKRSAINASGSRALLRWGDDNGEHDLTIERSRNQSEPPSVKYSVSIKKPIQNVHDP